MKNLIKILFAITLCLPFTVSAQWTDSGTKITTNDNVGIGGTNPGAKLHVNAGNGEGIRITSPNGNTHFPWTDGWSYISGKGLKFRTNGNNDRMIINESGNIGIGTTPSAAKLHINVGNAEGLRIASPNGNTHFPWTDGWSYISGKGLKFRTDGNNNRMIIDESGNVGIGTETLSNKLEVNGTIRTKEVIVEATGWPDYVFYNDYNLPTLEEEEKHIEAKGHLLGFESEKDMADEIQLGDVTERQQAKIEEMMLHLIEIKKEVLGLNNKVVELEKENEQLKKQISKN